MAKRSDEKLFDVLEVSECPPMCRAELGALIREAYSLRDCCDRLKAVKERIAEIVIDEQGLCNNSGIFGVRDGPHAVIVRQQEGRRTLDRELLIEHGVSPSQINASIKTGKPFNVVEFDQMTGD